MNTSRRSKFEIFRGDDKQFYFRLRDKNGGIILKSEGYKSLSGAKKGIDSIRRSSGDKSLYKRKISKDRKNYFVLSAKNGKIIGTSKIYSSQLIMEKRIERVVLNAPDAKIEEEGKSAKEEGFLKNVIAVVPWPTKPCENYILPENNLYPEYLTQLAGGLSANLYINGTQNVRVDGNQAIIVSGDQCISVGKNAHLFIDAGQNISVGKDQMMRVYGSQKTAIAKDQYYFVKGDQQLEIGNDQSVKVGKNYFMETGNNLDVEVGKDYNLGIENNLNVDVGNNYILAVGKKLRIDCGDELVVTVGKSRVTLKNNGEIEIFGNKINIKSTNELNIDGPNVLIKGSMSLTLVGTGTVVI